MKLARTLSFIAGLTAATLTTMPAPAAAEDVTKISFMEVIHSLFYSPLYVAIGNGYFEEEGLAFDLIAGQGSDKVTAALLSKSVDIALAGPETTLYVETGKSPEKIRIIAGLTATDGSFLVGHDPATGDFDWGSLKGKKILGWREGSSPAMFLRAALEKAGFDSLVDLGHSGDRGFGFAAGLRDTVTGVGALEPVRKARAFGGRNPEPAGPMTMVRSP